MKYFHQVTTASLKSVFKSASPKLSWRCVAGALVITLIAAGCGGGGGSGRAQGSEGADFGCDGGCTNQALSADEVNQIIRQTAAAAGTLGVRGTFAIVDRVGNVLAVYQMSGAPATTTVHGQIGAVGGLEGVVVPATLAAISKAGTGAYLSSQGNSFSTRTASQIIQENFDPGEKDAPGGPLFGVQFSQLLCSDITVRDATAALGIPSGSKLSAGGSIGPRALPLGLSADPGGIPLYKEGDLVGGLGVEFDGLYTLDRNIRDFDDDPEERVAMMGTYGFEAPSERAASNMLVAGHALRYTDLEYQDLAALPDPLPEPEGGLVAVPEFTTGTVRAGAAFGSAASGVMRTQRAGQPTMILVGPDGSNRFPTKSGAPIPGGLELQAFEVDAILDSAILTAQRARAAIRRPLDSQAHVSIWVIDHQGVPLGFTRTFDAPIFGIDVALQKARSAAFFSSADALIKLSQVRARNTVGEFGDYSAAAQSFVGSDALSGAHAITDRALGNISRPLYPDGIFETVHGPFSLPFPGSGATGRTWSPFNDGLQLDLVFQRLVAPLGIPHPPAALPDSCTDSGVLGRRLANGLQIFPGSVPLYRARTLIGAVGISGDGIDQDDMIAFLGASRPGLDFAGHTSVGDAELGFNAPRDMRSDQIQPDAAASTRLRYVNCPEGPFRGTDDQQVCDGL